MAIPVYSGIQNVRELLKYGEIRTSFDYDKQKWFAEGAKYLTTYYGQLSFLKIYPNKKFELNNLHSAVGIGLRLGLSRSAEKSVSHINLA